MRRPWRHRKSGPHRSAADRSVQPRLEEMENRLLFSADLPGLLGLPPAVLPSGQTDEGVVASTAEVGSDHYSDGVHREIVFVDAGVEDRSALLAGILVQTDPGIELEVVELDAGRDGVEQISEYLASRSNIDTVRVFAHGGDGEVALGSSLLDLDRLLAQADEVAAWGDALNQQADILIYGCDVAAGEDGENFLLTLASLTGADVAASNDVTGSRAAGGDWQLEYSTGSIESRAFANEDWGATLALSATNLSAPEGYIEDVPLSLQDIVVSAGIGATVSVSLELSDPAVGQLAADSGGPIAWTFADGVWSASGDVDTLNVLLASLRFLPAADFNGDFQLAVTVDDGATSLSGVKVFTGEAVEDAPLAGPDFYVVPEDGVLSTTLGIDDLLLNDGDADGDSLTVLTDPVIGPGHGTLVLNADGTFTYTPEADFHGSDSFTYAITDGNGNVVNGSASITVTPVNDAPVLDPGQAMRFTPIFQNDFDSAGESAGDVFGNQPVHPVTDVDGGAVDGFAIVGVDDSNGVWQYTTDNGNSWNDVGSVSDASAILLKGNAKAVRFVPDAGFTGSASITIRAWDGSEGANGAAGVDVRNHGGTSAFSAETGVVSINVLPRSGSMLFSTSGDVANSGQSVKSWSKGSIVALGEPDIQFEPGTSGGTFSIQTDLDAFAADGSVTVTGVHVVGGDVTLGADQAVHLQSGDLLFVTGESETLASSNSLSFGPGDIVAFRPDVAGDYSSGTFIHVLDNPAGASVTGISLVERSTMVGDVTLQPGSLVFTLAGDSSVYHFGIDEAGPGTTVGTTSRLVDLAEVTTGFSGDLAGVHLVTSPFSGGGVSLQAGTLIVATTATGDFTAGDNGVTVTRNDLVAFTIGTTNLGASGSASGTAEILFEGADMGLSSPHEQLRSVSLVTHGDGIIAGGESFVLAEDTSFSATLGVDDLLLNDSDADGDTLTVLTDPVSGPAHGTLVLNADGTFTYTPEADFHGSDSFTYAVSDGNGNTYRRPAGRRLDTGYPQVCV